MWLPDSPVHARVLTKEERVAALERVREDQSGTANKHWKRDQIIEAVTDVRTWLIVLTTLMSEYIQPRPVRPLKCWRAPQLVSLMEH